MSKRKTVLKFAIAAVLLGGSSTVAVLYFPYVALAIKSGVVVSAAPIVIFAISAMVALASVITLGVLAVSAMCSKGKSNEVSGEPRSKNEEEGQSLVQEEEQAVPIPTPPLLPQEPEELVTPVLQQQPGDNLIEEMETPQHEEDTNFMDNGDSAEQQAEQTKESLPSLPPYPEPISPMNNLESLPLPNLPSGAHHSLRNARNLLPSPSQQTRVKVLYNSTEDSLPPSPPIEPLNSMNQFRPFPKLPSIVVDGHNGSRYSSHSVQNCGTQNEDRTFYQEEEPSLSSFISSLYGSHYSASSDSSSSSWSTSPLSSLNGSSSSSVSSDCSNSSYDQQSSLPIAIQLKTALAERAQQHNQAGFVVEQGYYNSATGQALNSMDAAHMSMINDDFGSSYLSSTVPNSMPPLNNVHDIMHYRQNHPGESDLSSSIPGSMMVGGSINISLQQPRVNRVVRSDLPAYDVNNRNFDSIDPVIVEYSAQSNQSTNNEEEIDQYFSDNEEGPNDFGFYVSSTGQPLYGNIESPNSVVLEYSTQDQNIESGPSAMLWDVNNQQYVSMQPLSGSPSRSNG